MPEDLAPDQRSSRTPRDMDAEREFSETAFEAVYRDTFGKVWSMARRVARDDGEADDVSQAAYLALYRYWSSGRLREPPEHLLFRTAKNKTIDLLRARTRRVLLFARLPRASAATELSGTPLARALRRLRPEDASLVLMQAAAGFSYEEIARIERASVSAVRSRLFRARRQLATLFDEEGGTW
jgi:RNA polymerase sigma-70 factor (ECF subfamily)